MRRSAGVIVYALAATCWLAGGAGGVTVDALLACRHHQAHQAHGGHTGTPGEGPCFCDEMTGGSEVAVSPAVPAPLVAAVVVTAVPRPLPYASSFPLPPSPSFPPSPPPPNGPA